MDKIKIKIFYRSNILFLALILCWMFLSYSSFSLAQSVRKDSVNTFHLKEVVITGTRIKINKEEIPASITVIDNKEITESNSINILPVLSTQVPGLFVDAKNIAGYGIGPSAGGILTIRGIGGNPNSNVLVLIDGQPQFMGIFGHPIVDALNSSDIQRVEIIRGASSILYGTNALGGAINIITKQPALNKLSLNASTYYGTFKTLGVNGSVGYRNNIFGVFASLNNSNTDGIRTDAQDGFNTTAGYLKLSLTPAGAFHFIADGNLSKSKFYDPGTITNPTVNNYYNYLRTRGSFSILNNFNNFEGALRLFYSYGDHNFFNGWSSDDEMKGITFYQNIKYFDNNIFTFGIDYKNYGGKGTQPGLPPFVAKGLGIYHSADETAVYGLLNYSPFAPMNIEAGIRLTQNSLFGNDITPDFGITYSVNNTTTIKAAASKAFRSPTINELYLFPAANQTLTPEHVWNYEISLDKNMLNDYLTFSITAFYDEGDNLIVVTPPFNTNSNSGSFIHKGIEFAGKYLVNDNFNMLFNYSFLNCNAPTLYAPEHKINLMLNYVYKPLDVNLNLQKVAGLYTSIQNTNTESYFVLDATLNYSLRGMLKIFVKGGNLLNENYQIDNGYPMPGRNIMFGVKLNY